MLRYGLRRLLLVIPVLVGITFIVFALLAFAPGDYLSLALSSGISDPGTLARIRDELGLDLPWLARYGQYMGNLLRGDLGHSIVFGQSVTEQIMQALPNTLVLTVASMLFAVTISLGAGVLSAARRNTVFDYGAMVVAVAGVSIPSFWLGLLLILLFNLKLQWLPIGGGGTASISSEGLWGFLRYLVLPAVTLGSELAAILTRLTRNTLLDVLSEDYIRTARAKGVAGHVVLYKHALRNALLPVVTTAGIQFGGLLGGAVIIETIFSWPGMGLLTINAIQQRDIPVVQGTVLVFTAFFVLVILLTDLLYTVIDPRIHYD